MQGTRQTKIFNFNLTFREAHLEIEYRNQKQPYQIKVGNMFMIFFVLASIIFWFFGPMNPNPFGIWFIIFNVFKFIFLILHIFVVFKRPDLIQPFLTIIILLFSVGYIEGRAQQSNEGIFPLYWLYQGLIMESIIGLCIVLGIGWIQQAIVLLVQNFFIAFRLYSFDRMEQYKYFPLCFCLLSIIFFGFLGYVIEKHERGRFHEIKKKEESLIVFQRLIKEYLPLGVIVTDETEIIFSNLESELIFNKQHKPIVFEDLGRLRLEELKSQSFKELLKLEGIHKASPHLMRLSEVLKKKFWKENQRTFTRFKGFISDNPRESFEKEFLNVNVGKLFWNDIYSTIILLAEDPSALKVEYLNQKEIYKDRLLASLSHNLRTPLNGIMGMIANADSLINEPKAKER